VYPLDEGEVQQLTRDVRDDRAPTWSPDGAWVAFLSNRGGQPDVWMVPAAGGMEVRVTDDEAGEGNLQWIPGSTRLSFTSGTLTRGLWAISTTDGSERRLTPDSVELGVFDISNDGRNVVFNIPRGGGVSDLAVVSVESGEIRTLVANGTWNGVPRWSPDGSPAGPGRRRQG